MYYWVQTCPAYRKYKVDSMRPFEKEFKNKTVNVNLAQNGQYHTNIHSVVVFGNPNMYCMYICQNILEYTLL